MGPILTIFILRIGTNSGPTRLELKQFSMMRRSLPKTLIRVSKQAIDKKNETAKDLGPVLMIKV